MPQTVAVFTVSARAGKLDTLVTAPFEQGGIDKFTARKGGKGIKI
jgi:hypothetical protein